MSDLLKLTGIVLLAAPVGEYDKRVVILTKECGKITAFAKGVRRQNSPLLAAASPFASEGVFLLRRTRDLPTGTGRDLNISVKSRKITNLRCTVSISWNWHLITVGKEKSRNFEASLRGSEAMIRRQQPRKLVRYVYELRVLVMNGEYPEPFHCAFLWPQSI